MPIFILEPRHEHLNDSIWDTCECKEYLIIKAQDEASAREEATIYTAKAFEATNDRKIPLEDSPWEDSKFVECREITKDEMETYEGPLLNDGPILKEGKPCQRTGDSPGNK